MPTIGTERKEREGKWKREEFERESRREYDRKGRSVKELVQWWKAVHRVSRSLLRLKVRVISQMCYAVSDRSGEYPVWWWIYLSRELWLGTYTRAYTVVCKFLDWKYSRIPMLEYETKPTAGSLRSRWVWWWLCRPKVWWEGEWWQATEQPK